MNDFLNQQFLDNSVRNYLIVAGIILFVYFIRRYLSKGLAAGLFKLIKHWSPSIAQQEFVQLLFKPLEYFLLMTAFIMASNHLVFPSDLNVIVYNRAAEPYTLQMLLTTLLKIVFSMTIILILLRLIDFISLILEKKADLTEDKTDNQFIIFFRDFFKAIMFIIGAMILINILFGKDVVDKLVAGLGIGAAALALAAKESIENLIGSFIIFSDKPFRVGDFVKVDAFQGTVEKIGLRSTRLRTLEKTFVTVPNKKMVDSVLDNLSLRTQQRVSLKLELAGDTTSDKVASVVKSIQDYLDKHEDVEPGYSVNMFDFTKDSYTIQVIYMTNIIEGAAYLDLRENVNLAAISILEKNGVRLAMRTESTV
ncbi:mechanosensitive ion channel family protein [Chitinophaga barathri]|uniref:Mechanosensitive ion channel protein MscS n=1 Tax=Chitinophaga barathri TaxID=1647451 RepID=A0A3N4M901_9BACT|nr:mechanosensitive ion channel domain-containing protein [Chitinophaga barathri]RPD40154.1 mechanosensitive ion channel protein MscS [Chitinophaga barathri]